MQAFLIGAAICVGAAIAGGFAMWFVMRAVIRAHDQDPG